MSASGRNKEGRERLASDAYNTPAWCVHRLLDEVGAGLPGGAWLEPGAGDGAIVRAVGDYVPPKIAGECKAKLREPIRWTAVELRASSSRPLRAAVGKSGSVMVGDFLDYRPRTAKRFAVALGNPPFSLAQQFVERALQLADVVVMLARLNFLEGERRAEMMRRLTPSVLVLPNRPSFTGDGTTDATAYAWLAWGLDPEPRVRILGSTPKSIRCAR